MDEFEVNSTPENYIAWKADGIWAWFGAIDGDWTGKTNRIDVWFIYVHTALRYVDHVYRD